MSTALTCKPVGIAQVMKKYFLCVFIFLVVGLVGFPAGGQQTSFDFEFTLPVPVNEADRAYLGLSDKKTFTPAQINSRIVLIEIFSMYCPICQREAKRINQIFDLIRTDDQLKNRAKMIGIGAGNSQFETEFFRSNYSIEFPLFSDPTFDIHKGVGEVGTPHFFGLNILPGKKVKLFFSHSGPVADLEEFVQQLKDQSGLEF